MQDSVSCKSLCRAIQCNQSVIEMKFKHLLSLLCLAGLTATAQADCIDSAADAWGVNSVVLRAIGWHESGLKSSAVGSPNRNGTRDFGAFQINESVLRQYGVSKEESLVGCRSAEIAAKHLKRQMDEFGNTWRAVGAYHSRTPARANWYASRIQAILKRWQVIDANAPEIPGAKLAPNQPN